MMSKKNKVKEEEAKVTSPEQSQEPEKEPVDEVVEEEITEEAEPAEETDPVEDLQKQIEALTKELQEAKTDVARAYADTDNTRKRLLRDADMVKKYRFQQAALELLPILDNMDMALSQAPEGEEAQTFVKGFEMIRSQFENALTNEGVKEIEALNKPFDANTMQALMMEPAEGVEPGIVTQVLQKGYMLKDRLLRPALVKVSE